MLEMFIAMAGVMSICSYALYGVSADALGGHGDMDLLITVPFVVIGLLRYMMIIFRHDNDGDVADIILKDPFTFVVVLLWVITTGYFYITA